MLACSDLAASSLSEGNRLGQSIRYSGNTSVSMSCDEGSRCEVSVVLHGRHFRITQEMMGSEYPMMPFSLALSYSRDPDFNEYTVWLEYDCASEAVADPGIQCVATVEMRGSELLSVGTLTRRTIVDYEKMGGGGTNALPPSASPPAGGSSRLFDRQLVPDKETAIKLGHAVLQSYYGQDAFSQLLSLRGLDAFDDGDAWIVCHCKESGSLVELHEDSITLEMPVGHEVKIAKRNAEVLGIYLAK
jgi:hypothetical protein